jgi:hypothetical protein
MVRAMSELFAGLAHQYPEVVAFREDILGRLLSEDEAHALLASLAALEIFAGVLQTLETC